MSASAPPPVGPSRRVALRAARVRSRRSPVILLPALTALLACGADTAPARHPAQSGVALEGRLAGTIAGGAGADLATYRGTGSAKVAAAARRSADGSDASAAGRRSLAAGRFDAAVARLRSAVLRSDEWRDWNDLSVALVARAGAKDHPLDFLRALTAARHAAALAPDQPESRFNLALALSKLHLRRTAARAWESFLDAPPPAAIPEEDRAVADEYLERLTAPSRRARWERASAGLDELELPAGEDRIEELTREFPDLLRIHGERQLVARWSRAVLAGDVGDAARTEMLGRAIGAALVSQRGEHSVEDIFEFLRNCARRAERGVACAGPAAAYAEGVEAFYAGDLGLAERRLSSASAMLRELASPLRRWAEFFLVYATHHRDIPAAEGDLQAQLSPEVEARYPTLAGSVHWRLGVVVGSMGQNQSARDHYLRGETLIAAGGGPEEAIHAQTLLAEALDVIGDVERAWRCRMKLFGVAAYSGDSRQIQSMLTTAVLALFRADNLDAASSFVDELIQHVTEFDQPAYRAVAHRLRGELLAKTGRPDAALEELALARSFATRIGSSARQDQEFETIDLVEGAAWAASDPARGIELLSRALAGFDHADNALFRRMALGLRARTYERRGDLEAALEDRRTELDLLEDQRAAVSDQSRLIALEPAQEGFDAAVAILVQLGRYEEALTLAERSRCRYLLDLLGDAAEAATRPLPAATIQRKVPPGTVLVEYSVLARELAAWVVEGAGARLVRVPIPREALTLLVATLNADVDAMVDESAVLADSSALYQVLVAPLGLDLSSIDRLVVVPDRDLFRVPFAALYTEESSRFLIEDVAVAVTPSASLFLAEPLDGRTHDGPALVVGAPDLSGTAYSSLPRLPGALSEARAVHALYPGATLLEGPGATADELLAVLADARMLHFAGHALANSDHPLQSELLLAKSAGFAGTLTVGELLRRRVLGTPVVVLSACRTADGFAVDREGSLGLAAAFVATGSRAVLATLWQIDDRFSPGLLEDFHAGLLAGRRPSEAWRRSVVRMLGGSPQTTSSFRTWATFSLFEAARD